MTDSLIGRISDMLRNRQSAVASETQASVSTIADQIAAASGIKLTPPASPTDVRDSSSIAGALAAALHIAGNANPSLVPRWNEVASDAKSFLVDSGWRETGDDDELLFRTASAMRLVDQDRSYVVAKHAPSMKAITDFHLASSKQHGPFTENAPWNARQFFRHAGGGARALIGDKQVSSAIRVLILSADLGHIDAMTCAAMIGDARFDRLFYKAEMKRQGATLSLECTSPRGGRDGLSISLSVRVRDNSWLASAQEVGIPLGNCQIELVLEEAMY